MANVCCRSVVLYLRASGVLVLHALFVLLTLIRVLSEGESGSPSWYIVFSPLFLFDGLSIVLWVHYLVSYVALKRDEDALLTGRTSTFFPGQSVSLFYLVVFAVGIPLKISAEILLALRLEGDADIPAFAPATLLMVLFLEVGAVAAYEAASPVIRMCWTSVEREFDCEDCGCLNCMGYTNMYCRRCFYTVSSVCS